MNDVLKSDVTVIENTTLTGKKTLIGNIEENLIVQLKCSKKEFENRIENKDGKVLSMLQKYGLLEESENQKFIEFNEINLMGNRIVSKNFTYEPLEKKKLANIINIFFCIIVIVSIITLFKSYDVIKINPKELLEITIPEIFIVLAIYFISVILHEIGHVSFAYINGIKVRKVSFSLLYFLPIVTVEYYGFELHSLFSKVITILAGGFINIFIAIVLLENFELSLGIKLAILANISLFLLNTSFLSFSDGYFLFSVVTGIKNYRKKALLGLSSFKLNIYSIIFICTIIYGGIAMYFSLGIFIKNAILCLTLSLVFNCLYIATYLIKILNFKKKNLYEHQNKGEKL